MKQNGRLSKARQYDRLRHLLVEKRSDIADVLEAIQDGRDWKDDWIEHRHINAEIPRSHGEPIHVSYDTLTTEISFYNEATDQYEIAQNHKYEGD